MLAERLMNRKAEFPHKIGITSNLSWKRRRTVQYTFEQIYSWLSGDGHYRVVMVYCHYAASPANVFKTIYNATAILIHTATTYWLIFHGISKVYYDVRKVYYGVYHGVWKDHHGIRRVYHDVRKVCH